MKKQMIPLSLILLAFCLSAMATPAFAQGPAKTPDPAKKTVFDEMLAKVEGGDTSIDFGSFRIAYTETQSYSPYGTSSEKRGALNTALNEKKYKEAVTAAADILKTNYVDMNAHYGAMLANRELGNAARSDFHKAVFLGLVNSIIKSGDGKTANTAYVVISVPEEYVLISYLGYKRGNQALLNEGGHTYDLLTVTDAKTNEGFKIYFNIDIVWKGYDKIFKK